MEKALFRAVLMSAGFVLCGTAMAPAETMATPVIIAQTTPAPKATVQPSFTYGAYLRSFYFTRTNPKPPANGAAPNQASLNTAVSLHAGYNFGGGFSVAGIYLYANPFNACDTPLSHLGLPCAGHKVVPAGSQQQNNPDDTLPGYRLSTLYEAYLQYKDPNLFVRAGNQVINTPWANPSDSRLKPVAFRGADASYKIDANWTIEAAYMNRFEDRVQSDFVDSTLITQAGGAYPDAPGNPNVGLGKFGVFHTNGFSYGRAGYVQGPLSANLHYYAFDQIANALWADAKYSWNAYGKPFIALQGGTESNSGSSLAGKINSQIFGIQGGYSPWNNVDLTVGADFIPVKNDTITLPAGVACFANHELGTSKAGAWGTTAATTLPYFLPSGGTPNCVPAAGMAGVKGGTASVYYGGWASPYTDSYATDVLFDTSISQGMVDRRSPGSGVKVAGTFSLAQKHLRLIVSHAWYTYGNDTLGLSPTQETDIDGTYFFSKPGKGPYHGWSLRHRYAERTQDFTAPYGGSPDFKYNRTQLEFDF